MSLLIEESEVRGVTVVTLTGRVTLGQDSSQLRNKVKEILSADKTRIVLDLGGVSYMDSAGLGALVAGFTSGQSRGAVIKLANLTRKLNEQLHITKLVTVFEVFDSVDEAVNSFTKMDN